MVKTNKSTEIATVVIDATGILHVPNMPQFKGEETFKGQIFHSTQLSPKVKWDGLKVGIIGTASSAVQMTPYIAKTANQLNIFQRTPNWILPVNNIKYVNPMKYILENVSVVSYLFRFYIYINQELLFLKVFNKESKNRQVLESTLIQLYKSQVNSELSEKLIPNYPIGCKRIVISHNFDYISALKDPKVKLLTEDIQCFTPTGIQTNKSHYEADIIVCATGFHPIIKNFEIIGKNNCVIKGPGISYWGITYPNVPNLFMILGPNTALGHNSVIWMGECQINYIISCISYIIENNVKELTVKSEKSDQWFKRVQSKFSQKVWTASCHSWYKTPEGEIWTLWPDFSFHYWWGTTRAVQTIRSDYNIL